MSGRAFDYATEAFDFIDGLNGLAGPDDVVEAVARTFSLFGFENFILTGLPNPKSASNRLCCSRSGP